MRESQENGAGGLRVPDGLFVPGRPSNYVANHAARQLDYDEGKVILDALEAGCGRQCPAVRGGEL